MWEKQGYKKRRDEEGAEERKKKWGKKRGETKRAD